jgi:BON domain-containing protein
MPRSRIVVDTSQRAQTKARPASRTPPRNPEPWIAISVIAAAALATFIALFITSRPFDPGTASLAPQQNVPAGPALSPSPRQSPAISPTPQAKPSLQASPAASAEAPAPVDDASIQSRIDSALAADPALAKLDVSTLVEGGKVTIVGSVRSTELKQRIEKTIRLLKGVAAVDNQLVVNEATP